jgi:hypothetical protein
VLATDKSMFGQGRRTQLSHWAMGWSDAIFALLQVRALEGYTVWLFQ